MSTELLAIVGLTRANIRAPCSRRSHVDCGSRNTQFRESSLCAEFVSTPSPRHRRPVAASTIADHRSSVLSRRAARTPVPSAAPCVLGQRACGRPPARRGRVTTTEEVNARQSRNRDADLAIVLSMTPWFNLTPQLRRGVSPPFLLSRRVSRLAFFASPDRGATLL